jgi:hypothetical protein
MRRRCPTSRPTARLFQRRTRPVVRKQWRLRPRGVLRARTDEAVELLAWARHAIASQSLAAGRGTQGEAVAQAWNLRLRPASTLEVFACSEARRLCLQPVPTPDDRWDRRGRMWPDQHPPPPQASSLRPGRSGTSQTATDRLRKLEVLRSVSAALRQNSCRRRPLDSAAASRDNPPTLVLTGLRSQGPKSTRTSAVAATQPYPPASVSPVQRVNRAFRSFKARS